MSRSRREWSRWAARVGRGYGGGLFPFGWVVCLMKFGIGVSKGEKTKNPALWSVTPHHILIGGVSNSTILTGFRIE
ncbi:MAG: hypothetical protein Q4D38_13050, partial [Planctomycetia bacterium]|nr:hypothetical protein [Planctomycetia bacterium]